MPDETLLPAALKLECNPTVHIRHARLTDNIQATGHMFLTLLRHRHDLHINHSNQSSNKTKGLEFDSGGSKPWSASAVSFGRQTLKP